MFDSNGAPNEVRMSLGCTKSTYNSLIEPHYCNNERLGDATIT
jgi:hypothetical protein